MEGTLCLLLGGVVSRESVTSWRSREERVCSKREKKRRESSKQREARERPIVEERSSVAEACRRV